MHGLDHDRYVYAKGELTHLNRSGTGCVLTACT